MIKFKSDSERDKKIYYKHFRKLFDSIITPRCRRC